MDIMFELTRRCNMQCSHCLRGDAEGKDMSEHTMSAALRMFGSSMSQISMGGGEITLKPKLLASFLQQIYWSHISTGYLEPTWFVTNGKRLLKQMEPYMEGDPYNDEYEGSENTELVEVLIKYSNLIPINLAVSTDSWHDVDAERRHRHVEAIFEEVENVTVVAHGPRNSEALLSMGRNAGGGKNLEIEAEGYLIYITINGDIYTSCDLSYSFMDMFKNSSLCLGNIHTSSWEEIEAARERLDATICINGDSTIAVDPYSISEFEKLEEKYNELIKVENLVV